MTLKIYTIGHSTHSLTEFITMLENFGVNFLVDVRTIPRSRTNPQYNKESLPGELERVGIFYRHIQALGGRRSKITKPVFENSLWRNGSFKNYADYAATADFRVGLEELKMLAADHVCAIMCAEAVWWRCHRRIIADYLLASGINVEHIMSKTKADIAKMTPGAHVLVDQRVMYMPSEDNTDFRLEGLLK